MEVSKIEQPGMDNNTTSESPALSQDVQVESPKFEDLHVSNSRPRHRPELTFSCTQPV